jgi:hypothetical protein
MNCISFGGGITANYARALILLYPFKIVKLHKNLKGVGLGDQPMDSFDTLNLMAG